MIKYEALRGVVCGKLVKRVTVSKETATNVWINGCRHAKKSPCVNYFDSFDEAKAFLTEYAEQVLNSARYSLESALKFTQEVRGLKEIINCQN